MNELIAKFVIASFLAIAFYGFGFEIDYFINSFFEWAIGDHMSRHFWSPFLWGLSVAALYDRN